MAERARESGAFMDRHTMFILLESFMESLVMEGDSL